MMRNRANLRLASWGCGNGYISSEGRLISPGLREKVRLLPCESQLSLERTRKHQIK